MRVLLCHCRHHLEADDGEPPATAPTDEQAMEIVSTRPYDLEYTSVSYEGGVGPGEEFGYAPFIEHSETT
jgi:hypothetical protein